MLTLSPHTIHRFSDENIHTCAVIDQEEYLKARCIAPCDVEITALIQLSAVPVSVHLLDGREIEVAANSWTSAANLEKQVKVDP